MVAIVTPMREDGALDREALKSLIDWQIANGTSAIVAVGTTGESPTLDLHEHCEVIRLAVEYTAGRVPVIAGTGANATSEAIELTRCAIEAGANAALLVTPYYNKPTQEGLYRHHRAIAKACVIPQILYNVPGRTACDLLPATVQRLSTVENIVGIKEATGNLDRVREIRKLCGERFEIYSGDDATGLDAMMQGARGVISVTTNVAPRAMADLCAAALTGDEKTARAINEKLMPLHRDLFVEANPIPVKWVLHEMRRIAIGIRLPLTPLSIEYHERLRAAMRAAEITGGPI